MVPFAGVKCCFLIVIMTVVLLMMFATILQLLMNSMLNPMRFVVLMPGVVDVRTVMRLDMAVGMHSCGV